MNAVVSTESAGLPMESEWKERLIGAKAEMMRKTIPAFIEFGREVHQFRLHCDSSRGGSEFTKKGCEWLGCSSSSLQRWDSVGRRADELSPIVGKLPSSESAIAKIASLDDELFPVAVEKLDPGMSQKQVSELIQDIDPIRPTHSRGYGSARREIRMFRKLPKASRRLCWEVLRHEFSKDTAVQVEKSLAQDPVSAALELLTKMDDKQFAKVKDWINQSVDDDK